MACENDEVGLYAYNININMESTLNIIRMACHVPFDRLFLLLYTPSVPKRLPVFLTLAR